MPNKYSHGLVFSQQSWAFLDNHLPPHLPPPPPPPSSSLKPTPSPSPRSHTRSAESSVSYLSGYSAQNAVIADYIRPQPDIGPDSSSDYGSASHTTPSSVNSTPADAPQLESTAPGRSRPVSGRLRLESPPRSRTEESPSPPLGLKPRHPDRPRYDISPSHHPDAEPSPQDRVRLVNPSPNGTRNPRPSLHHKNSSVETQIYAPKQSIPPPPAQEAQDVSSMEPSQPRSTPPVQHESQSTHFTDSPKNSRPPTSTGHRQERFSPETWPAYLPSPTRDPRQSFIQKTAALASPQSAHVASPISPTPAENPSLSPSGRDLQDFFLLSAYGSQPTSAAKGKWQKKSRSPLPTSSQDSQDRPSLDIHRLHSPPPTQGHRNRPSFESRHFPPESQSRTAVQSINGRRPSIDTQPTLGEQAPRSLGPRRSSFDRTIKHTPHSRSHSSNSKTAQDSQPLPFSNSQQLSWEQFVHESENIREPLIDSETYSSQTLSFYTRRPNSRDYSLADSQRYTPKNTSLAENPRSSQDRHSRLPDTLTQHHRILSPTGPGTYDNVTIETHGFPPKRPPSPPATPRSDKSYSLTPHAAESQKSKSSAQKPQHSVGRSLSRQRSTLHSTNSSISELRSEPPRPKTSSGAEGSTTSRKAAGLHSPTFSISTRASSINATKSPPSVVFSNFSDVMTSPRPAPLSHSKDRGYFDDADLSPLPSEIDFNVLPYEDPNAGPAIFRATQLGAEKPTSPSCEDAFSRPAIVRATQLGMTVPEDEAASSRTSSFDSAAPPPIGLNRRESYVTWKTPQPKTPKKEGKTSLLSFLRSTPTSPKTVLYSDTSHGKPPLSASVSRSGIPSIPLLFPGYRGKFPPPPPPPQRDTVSSSRPSLEPRARPPRSLAHMDAADKRRSWLKGDDAAVVVDRNHRTSRLEKKREFERILKAL